ncbi:MAG: DJ-1/PfpI family protein [Promethearchaeota archaeon]
MSKQKLFLMLVGDFVEDYEAFVPLQILDFIEQKVHVVCPDKKKDDTVKTAVHDFLGDQTYTEKPGHLLKLNYSFDDVNPNDYDALIIPGGRSPEYLRLNKKVIEIVKHFIKEKKPIAAVCHGPQILAAAGGLQNKHVCPYPAVGPECILAGATVEPPGPTFTNVSIDGNLVTAPAWPALGVWMRKFLIACGVL